MLVSLTFLKKLIREKRFFEKNQKNFTIFYLPYLFYIVLILIRNRFLLGVSITFIASQIDNHKF